jgi:hypothetical protein
MNTLAGTTGRRAVPAAEAPPQPAAPATDARHTATTEDVTDTKMLESTERATALATAAATILIKADRRQA